MIYTTAPHEDRPFYGATKLVENGTTVAIVLDADLAEKIAKLLNKEQHDNHRIR